MKPMVDDENIDPVNVVRSAVVMDDFVLNKNAIHVDAKIERLGRIIPKIVHAMVMVDKHPLNYVMIVKDEVINKNEQTCDFLFSPCLYLKQQKRINEIFIAQSISLE